jgi:hypothetical protein
VGEVRGVDLRRPGGDALLLLGLEVTDLLPKPIRLPLQLGDVAAVLRIGLPERLGQGSGLLSSQADDLVLEGGGEVGHAFS